MKKSVVGMITVALLLFFGGAVCATPMPVDISTADWETDTGVSKSGGLGGTIGFDEFTIWDQFSLGSFFNNSFIVDSTATFLSFDFSLTSNDNLDADFIQFDIILDPLGTPQSVYSAFPGPPIYSGLGGSAVNGSDSIDISAYRGQTVGLYWTLSFDINDLGLGTIAQVSNIQIDTAPIPEPSCLFLFGIGLLAVTNRVRKIE